MENEKTKTVEQRLDDIERRLDNIENKSGKVIGYSGICYDHGRYDCPKCIGRPKYRLGERAEVKNKSLKRTEKR